MSRFSRLVILSGRIWAARLWPHCTRSCQASAMECGRSVSTRAAQGP